MKKLSKKNVFVITLILVLLMSFIVISIFNKRFMPIISSYAESEMKRIITLVINRSVGASTTNQLDIDDLFILNKNADEEIITVDFNPVIVNNVLREVTTFVQDNLKKVENGDISILDMNDIYINDLNYQKLSKGIIFEVPFGIIFNNSVLNNIGPYIPIRLNLIGNVTSNVNIDVKEYGINNSIINVYVTVTIEEKMILPLLSKNVFLSVNVPIATKIVQGRVPTYFQNGISGSSNLLSVPIG